MVITTQILLHTRKLVKPFARMMQVFIRLSWKAYGMYPLGHMALGYFSARATSSITGSKFNLFLVWFISVSPDIDVLIPFLTHRGPTHSLMVIIFFLVPVLLFRREWLPYVAGLGSHALIGDLITGTRRMAGCMLL